MAKRADIKKILVIGSGPIIIGQAAEFDYAGTQACLALKEEGYEVVLVNSNPATIMTDTNIADKVYMEPLTLDYVAKIIRHERPDALLPSLGGQTGLNLATQLHKKGVLEECDVEILGTPFDAIDEAEDRDRFKELCIRLGEPVLESKTANSIASSVIVANEIGYPIIVRPAFTMGGSGGGFANDDSELKELVKNALKLSPVNQVLIEKSIKGFKEIEYEVMRDCNDTVIVICNMENVDPVGIHTGDSMVVAPSQTLTNKEYQMLRNSALKIIRELGIVGGCNVQYALDPNSMQYYLIEVNPRVSRSSALASKASGYPIARVSAKLAIGLHLEDIEISSTNAAFEPTLDYVVTKIARFPFDKFKNATRDLFTQMKATGEVMAIGRTFEESFLKGIRSLEVKADHIYHPKFDNVPTNDLLRSIETPTDERIFEIAELLRRKVGIDEIFNQTKITKWFLNKFEKITKMEETLKNSVGDIKTLITAKKMGFSDDYIAHLWKTTSLDIYNTRKNNNIVPVYKMIDTCASEFDSYVPYFYGTYEQENESVVTDKKSIIVLGSGPIRIGQGVEFDYSSVHAIWAIQEKGYEAIIINNNPETVSTDYTTSDKLYFEPLNIEDVMAIIDLEKPEGVIVQLGGQTALNLSEELERRGVNIIGTSNVAINKAEDRYQFEELMNKLDIPQPKGKTVVNVSEGIEVANELGYPVLVRPSFVLGGRGMQVVNSDTEISEYLTKAVKLGKKSPVLVDKYIVGKEVEVDAICDGTRVFIPGIMEHVEKTGVHSGDSISVYPTFSISESVKTKIGNYTKKLGLAIGIIGLFNVQFIVDECDNVFVIEVNPRSSRTVPFLSKVTGVPMANIATKIMLGSTLDALGYKNDIQKERSKWYVKAPSFSFSKIKGIDAMLSPEMKSTGEAIGYDEKLERALYKALQASGMEVANYGTLFVTVADRDKITALPLIRKFYDLGFNIQATDGTAKFLKENKIRTKTLKKISEGSEEILDGLRKGHITYMLNTLSTDNGSSKDGYEMRRVAVENNITMFTSLDTIAILLRVLEEITIKVARIDE